MPIRTDPKVSFNDLHKSHAQMASSNRLHESLVLMVCFNGLHESPVLMAFLMACTNRQF